MNVPKMPTPTTMMPTPANRPALVTGYWSPYPTVEIVAIVYQSASDAVVMLAPGASFSM